MSNQAVLLAIADLERIHGCKIDAVLADGTHRYWSTHCRHGNHDDCSATMLVGPRPRSARGHRVLIPRQPAQCKTCAAPCICPCHGASGE